MSVFRDRFARQQSRLDKAFGELLEIRHVVAGEFVGGRLDPNRPPFQVIGILDMPRQVVAGGGSDDGAKAELVMLPAQADFDASQFSEAKPPPEQGTIVVAVGRSDQPKFRVRKPLPDGVSRIVCDLEPI